MNLPSSQAVPVQGVAPRPARSRSGCLTCRRRKVRCDELRPRCSHCTRLDLQCKWRAPSSATPVQWRFVSAHREGQGHERQDSRQDVQQVSRGSHQQSHGGHHEGQESRESEQHGLNESQGSHQGQGDGLPVPSPTDISDDAWLRTPGAVDQLFDYASFMWEPMGPPYEPEANLPQTSTALNRPVDLWPSVHARDALRTTPSMSLVPQHQPRPPHQQYQQHDQQQQVTLADRPAATEDHDLINLFIRAIVPPILAEVESERRWSSMRQMLIAMANRSPMARSAILAFSRVMAQRQHRDVNPDQGQGQGQGHDVTWQRSPRHHYEASAAEVASLDPVAVAVDVQGRQVYLASLFFLCYVDILEDRMAHAHGHLKRAYAVLQHAGKPKLGPVEVRLLSWIRLLDARAVSAGGEGLFLSSSSSELLLAQPSPAVASSSCEADEGAVTEDVEEWDVEDSLFQVLHSPGVAFFQEVQSYMGRISMIDPWHRSRGTVEDEVEVTRVAARIIEDLRALYERRPTLMDVAVRGDLLQQQQQQPPHLSARLAAPITRAFRTYLSNYYASKVHLHRVAFKHLPLSREAAEAVAQVRRLTRLLADAAGDGDGGGAGAGSGVGSSGGALPVSQLWPLLMLGSEEEDPIERAWIRAQIMRMARVATNAGVTARVLDEVQARQDASKARADIRSVMHDIFDSCFAIM